MTRAISTATPQKEEDQNTSTVPTLMVEKGKPIALPDHVIRVLIEVASNTRQNAYAPYSGYLVGAAILTKMGNVYGGCNIENASYGITLCAERAAAAKAVSEGERDFIAVAVVTNDGATPCGACRQFLHEFGGNTWVILADTHNHYTQTTVEALLPQPFSLCSRSS